MKRRALGHQLKNQKGLSLVFVAICIFALLSMAALSIDIFHLVVARGELQNAADAGALAGARFLYNDNGTSVNAGCNDIAMAAATANQSEKVAVEVAAGEVRRGHWSFNARTFTPNDALAPIDLWNTSSEELDANINFINAIEVKARRNATPVASWFARIFGYQGFAKSATAVAYIGFAGSLAPGEADQPIGICKQALLLNGLYQCNVGRMLNSGSKTATHNTAGWTNFTQPCETASASSMRQLICKSGNPAIVEFGNGIGTTGGVEDSVLKDMESCWRKATGASGGGTPNRTWELTLPVIDCPGNNVSNCARLVGAVTLKVIWIEDKGNDYKKVPIEMTNPPDPSWPSASELGMSVQSIKQYFVGQGPSDTFPSVQGSVGDYFYLNSEDAGRVRWASFIRRFNLKNADDNYATFDKKSLYFLPDCKPHEPKGNSQGENFGVLAKIPVLVR